MFVPTAYVCFYTEICVNLILLYRSLCKKVYYLPRDHCMHMILQILWRRKVRRAHSVGYGARFRDSPQHWQRSAMVFQVRRCFCLLRRTSRIVRPHCVYLQESILPIRTKPNLEIEIHSIQTKNKTSQMEYNKTHCHTRNFALLSSENKIGADHDQTVDALGFFSIKAVLILQWLVEVIPAAHRGNRRISLGSRACHHSMRQVLGVAHQNKCWSRGIRSRKICLDLRTAPWL